MNKSFTPNSNLDQHFLVDKETISDLVKYSNIKKDDVILEIGPGFGELTKELSKKAKKIIAVDIDERFKEYLINMPKNVEIHFGNALNYLKKEREEKSRVFNKIVSSPPYNLCEQILQYLALAKHVEKTILIVPTRFSKKVQENPFFNSFFNFRVLREVPKESFDPIPRVNSAILEITNKEGYEKDKDISAFIKRKLYMHEKSKLKNALVGAIIDFGKVSKQKITKNKAKEIIDKSQIKKKTLGEQVKHISKEVLKEIGKIIAEVILVSPF